MNAIADERRRAGRLMAGAAVGAVATYLLWGPFPSSAAPRPPGGGWWQTTRYGVFGHYTVEECVMLSVSWCVKPGTDLSAVMKFPPPVRTFSHLRLNCTVAATFWVWMVVYRLCLQPVRRDPSADG